MYDDRESRHGSSPEHGGAPAAVTLFGSNDPLDDALSEALGERGCRTHRVTVTTGWLSTSTDAVIRIDTPAGAEALRDLCQAGHPLAHVVATCTIPDDQQEADLVLDLCRRCAERNELSLIWHPPLDPDLGGPHHSPDVSVLALATEAAEELTGLTGGSEPFFSARSFNTV